MLGIVPPWAFANCTSLYSFVVEKKLTISANAFRNVEFSKFMDFGNLSEIPADFLEAIQDAQILCTDNSILKDLSYDGYNIHVIKKK